MHYFEIILKRKRELVALLLLSYICLVTVNVLWFYLTVPWAGLQCVIVVYPDHTHFYFVIRASSRAESLWCIIEQWFRKSCRLKNVSFYALVAFFGTEPNFLCNFRR